MIFLPFLASCGEKNADHAYPDQEAIVLRFIPDTGWYEVQQHTIGETSSSGMEIHLSMGLRERLYFGMAEGEKLPAEIILEGVRISIWPANGNLVSRVYNTDYPDSTEAGYPEVKARIERWLGYPIHLEMSTRGVAGGRGVADSLIHHLGAFLGTEYELSGTFWAIPFPEQAVKPGESWDYETEKDTERGIEKNKTTYTLKRYTADSVYIHEEGRIETLHASQAYVGIQFLLTYSGELSLGRKTGIVHDAKWRSDATMRFVRFDVEIKTKMDIYSAVRKK